MILILFLNKYDRPPVRITLNDLCVCFLIKLIKKETRKSFKIIITGGFSKLIKNPIKTKVIVDKDITLKGLIKILELIK